MASTRIDLALLIDPRELCSTVATTPWTFLAFPRGVIDEDGVPGDLEAQEYIAAFQSQGVPVGIWIDTPVEGVVHAFVGPRHIQALNDALEALRDSRRRPDGYASQLTNRLLGVDEPS